MSNHAPDLMACLKQLIATPSVSSVQPEYDQTNIYVIDLLANWLTDLGFTIEIMPLPKQPHKANLIAALGKGPGGLVLSGHTDTVPFDADRWQSDPFELTERDNKLFGLGSADMKGFMGLAIEAAKQFNAKQFKSPLILLATADEESSIVLPDCMALLKPLWMPPFQRCFTTTSSLIQQDQQGVQWGKWSRRCTP